MNDGSTSTASVDVRHENRSVSEAVVDAVADAKGVSTTDLHPPLYSVIDPDALDALVASMTGFPDGSPGRVAFTHCGYEVEVAGNGEVSVAEAEPRAASYDE